jgi:tetratricopeptide (TPR) repeat protein
VTARSDRRHAELIQASNYFSEQAVLAYLDGVHEDALTAADLAIKNQRELAKHADDESEVLDVLAGTLRDRAEIISVVAPTRPPGRAATKLFRQAIRDAEEGIELYKQHGGASGKPAPLWIASVQIQLAELYAAIEQPEQAEAAATAALIDYRTHAKSEERSQLGLAHALSRYAKVMVAIGAAADALNARREAVRRYRPWRVTTGFLWEYRFDRTQIWASTPTLERASQTARDLAEQLGPPDATAAPEALAALQDAAEGFAALVTTSMLRMPDTTSWAEMATAREVVLRMVEWLDVIGANEPAAAYLRMAEHMTGVVSHNFLAETAGRFAQVETAVRSLRPLIESYVDPPSSY